MGEWEDPIAVLCPRCKRIAVGWPLKRGDLCSPKAWGLCIREPLVILQKEKSK